MESGDWVSPHFGSNKTPCLGASLVVQWLRIHLLMQGTWVRSLAQEDPTCPPLERPTQCSEDPAQPKNTKRKTVNTLFLLLFIHYFVDKPKSQDISIRLLFKLHRLLAGGADSTFNQVLLKRLFVSPTHQPHPLLSWMTWKMKHPGQESKTAVVAGIITDDVCFQVVLKRQVCALWSCGWAAAPRAASSMPGASSSPLTRGPGSSLSTAVAMTSPVLGRAKRCPGILPRPQEPSTATSRAQSLMGQP